MPAPFPHRYDVRLFAGTDRAVLSGGGRRADVVGGAPPEFDGRDDWWSPEHLLLASVSLCHMTTFQALARRSGLSIEGYESQSEGVLDKTRGGLAFTTIRVLADVRVAEADRGRAGELLHSAERHCIVSNALRPAVEVEAVVNGVSLSAPVAS